MKRVILGTNRETGQPVPIPRSALDTHLHLMGGTGKGKTTALHTILHALLLDPFDQSCFVIVDRLGNFSAELLLWLASDFCSEDVRERLLYIEPAREDRVLGFNPLLYDTPAHAFYKVARATDVILRAWESVDIEAMPRLARWTFNAFYAAAQLGLTIADCVHFLMPGSPYHAPLLAALPPRLKYEWQELTTSRSGEVLRILDSSRNRLKPYFESDILRRMFGATHSRLDVARFMREGRIVILNLAPKNRLSGQLSNAIGALVLHEILATARSLDATKRSPTYLVLDEFQNFVGPDMEAALPEVRQLQLKLLLSHQSFAQLARGDHDLTAMIFQAQSRLIFGLQGEDADVLAHELASLTFDPMRIKDEIYTRRQLHAGHSIVELTSWSDADAQARQWRRDYGDGWSEGSSRAETVGRPKSETRTASSQHSRSLRTGEGSSTTSTHTRGGHETLVPTYDEFLELSSRTYSSFDEQRSLWAKRVRSLPTGTALLRLVNDPALYDVAVKRSAPGYLGWDMARIAEDLPDVLEDLSALLEKNFQSEFFTTPEAIDRETEARLKAVLRPVITLQSEDETDDTAASASGSADPFP